MNKYKIGQKITGTVTGIEDYGIFVSLNDKTSGLIHISEISDSYVNDVNDYTTIGKNINAKIIGIEDNNKLKLSIKKLYKNNSLNKGIKETSSGFSTLRKQLDIWINNTDIEKLKKNEKKNN